MKQTGKNSSKARPLVGMLVMLAACAGFLAFLALLTVVVYFIML